jgi:hypothetical protein
LAQPLLFPEIWFAAICLYFCHVFQLKSCCRVPVVLYCHSNVRRKSVLLKEVKC